MRCCRRRLYIQGGKELPWAGLREQPAEEERATFTATWYGLLDCVTEYPHSTPPLARFRQAGPHVAGRYGPSS